MKILVTGGAGFIGSHVASAFQAAGHGVVVIDDLSSGKRAQVPEGARFYQLDIQSPEVRDVFLRERPDVLSHHAAQMEVRRSVADPGFDARVNILGLINLLEAARAAGTRRVLFASSGGAGYGEQEEFPAPETHRLQPVSPYGVSKIAGELYLACFRAMHGIDWVAMRYANVYGPRQDPHGEAGVVAIFTQKVLRGETPTIHGDGLQTRDYVYVGDIVRANLALVDHSFSGPLNFGSGIETDVCRLFELIAAACGSSLRASHGPAKPGEQRRSVVSPALAKRVLGWEPRVSLRDGIAETVRFFRSEGGGD
jgi:UDP-glucose 4-epimerase